MKKRVFIDGREGTTGLRIFERFEKRDDIELMSIESELRKDPEERKRLINSSDITFLCLPDAAAREAVAMVENPDVTVIDTSTAHRTEPGWAYGFPELSAEHREKIATEKKIAVPGCHASGIIALLYPLTKSGLLTKEALVHCMSISGYSGAGKKAIAAYGDADRPKEFSSPRQYALTQQHKHLKEIIHVCGLNNAPVFSPLICDYYSGMEVSVQLHASELSKKTGLDELRELYCSHYDDSAFIRVRESGYEEGFGGFYGANNLSGLDIMEIMVNGNDDRILLTSRFDNLGKGASGAAIQCMNISMGIDEKTGLVL